MLVVSDTSPISNLFMVGKLDFLLALFDEIVIPPAVMREVREVLCQQILGKVGE